MQNNQQKSVLVVENENGDFGDIMPCLGEYESERWETLNNVVFDNIANTYFLCVCDILDYRVPTIDEFKDIKAFGSFRRGIKNISRLYQKNGGNLIIITKVPVSFLVEYFNLLDDDKDVRILFPEHKKLVEELRDRMTSPFDLHEQGTVRIITKPDHNDETDKKIWQERFKKRVGAICNPK